MTLPDARDVGKGSCRLAGKQHHSCTCFAQLLKINLNIIKSSYAQFCGWRPDTFMHPSVTPCHSSSYQARIQRRLILVWKTCSRCLWQIPSTHVILRQW